MAKNSHRNPTNFNSPDYRRFWKESSKVHAENSEYETAKDGKIVGGKSPNHKKIREFYKKWDKFNRLRNKHR